MLPVTNPEGAAPAIGSVAQLWRYPISSAGGEKLESADLDTNGIAGDRLWGLADLESNAVANPSERRWRRTPEIGARTASEGLEVRMPGEDWRPADTPQARAALTRHFGFAVGIRPHPPFAMEADAESVAPRYRRANLHILTTASMEALGALIPAGSVVDARRFRPNLVVRTTDGLSGLVEHDWVGRDLAIGGAVVRVAEPCSRCAFTTLAQGDLPFDRSILSAIVSHGGGGFGVYCTVLEPHRIGAGDPVTLL